MSVNLSSIDLFDVLCVEYKSTTWRVRGFDLAHSSSKQSVANTVNPQVTDVQL